MDAGQLSHAAGPDDIAERQSAESFELSLLDAPDPRNHFEPSVQGKALPPASEHDNGEVIPTIDYQSHSQAASFNVPAAGDVGVVDRPERRYALIEDFAPWIPELDPKSKRARSFGIKIADRRMMLVIQASSAMFLSLIALGLVTWSIIKNPPIDGIGTFMTGDCSMIEHWNTAAHVILNFGNTLFLGVGNYSMQVLVAPTRREADKRHEKGKSLDIGIHSFRNLRWIAWKRVIIRAFLGAIATVLHLL